MSVCIEKDVIGIVKNIFLYLSNIYKKLYYHFSKEDINLIQVFYEDIKIILITL